MKSARAFVLLTGLALSTCASPPSDGNIGVPLELIEDGKTVAGLLRVTDASGRVLPVPPLLPRGFGLKADHPANEWHVLPGATTVRLPAGKLTIEAYRGLETELARVEIDGHREVVRIPLKRFSRVADHGWRGANTHLHLKDVGRADADRYLAEVPRADGLDALFVSFLERKDADQTYVSNGYTESDLARLTKDTGVVFGWGEEHRHNFGSFEEGYGHVMFLDLRKLIRPVSIGRGIMKSGADAPPLRDGIDEAKRQGATVLWCHNTFGLEDIPNWLQGRPHAQNIFDGDPEDHGNYQDTFYRYLNAGLRVPFSTGTDWFIYDFSRAYASVPSMNSSADWLKALEAGKTFITNGPLLELDVEGQGPGGVLLLDRLRPIRIRGRAVGRVDFKYLELVHNGLTFGIVESRPVEGHFEASIDRDLPGDPGWWALRTPPPPVKPTPLIDAPRSELGGFLFAHTSAVHVETGGRSLFKRDAAEGLLAEMKEARAKILKNGVFTDDHQRDHVLEVYALAISSLERKLGR